MAGSPKSDGIRKDDLGGRGSHWMKRPKTTFATVQFRIRIGCGHDMWGPSAYRRGENKCM